MARHERIAMKVPARGLRFEAEIVPAGEPIPPAATDTENPPESTTDSPAVTLIPFRTVARTNKASFHPWWSDPTIHDFAGMTAPDKVPVNFCHEQMEAIGYGDNIDASSGELIITGALTSLGSDDRAAEIKAKWDAGVPFQASIEMGEEGLIVEQVAAGMTAIVNGQTVEGPVVIFRAWQLRGVAILLAGADDETNIQFAAKGDTTATVYRMKEAATAAPAAQKRTGPEYLATFGAVNGGRWFAEGRSWEEATRLHVTAMQAETAKYQAENKALKAQVEKLRGGSPVSFQAEQPPKPGPVAAQHKDLAMGLPAGLAKFAASLTPVTSRK